MTTHADLVVVGAGSGGFGAAYAAARLGARVVLIEASNGVGGTSTWAGVNNWEPVAEGTSFPAQLYQALISTGDACLPATRLRLSSGSPLGGITTEI